jgi:hypothetical protein
MMYTAHKNLHNIFVHRLAHLHKKYLAGWYYIRQYARFSKRLKEVK